MRKSWAAAVWAVLSACSSESGRMGPSAPVPIESEIGVARAALVASLDKDTTIFANQTTHNLGGHASVCAGTIPKFGGSERRTLLRFSLANLPANAQIASATLTLQAENLTCTPPSRTGACGGVAGVLAPFGVYRLTRDWTEGTIGSAGGSGPCGSNSSAAGIANWTQAASGVNWTTAGGDFMTTPTATTTPASNTSAVSWDVTADVKLFLAGTASNFGWLIKPTNPATPKTAIRFSSKSGATPPALSIVLANGSPGCTVNTDCQSQSCVNGTCAGTNRVWTAPLALEASTTISTDPRAAISNNGTAMVTFVQTDKLFARRYSGTAWAGPALIQPSTGNSLAPGLAMDGSGNAIAGWQEWSSSRTLWNRFSSANGTWGTASVIDPADPTSNANPLVGVDGSGNAIAMFATLGSARLAAGAASWTLLSAMRTKTSGVVAGFDLAVDAQGNAIAVWSESNGTGQDIWANNYRAGAWGGQRRLETLSNSADSTVDVAVNAAGDGVAVWAQSSNTSANDVWISRYKSVNNGWTAASRVPRAPNGGTDFGLTRAAIDGAGVATVAWIQTPSTNIRQLWTNRGDASNHFSATPHAIQEADVAGSILSTYDIAADSAGDVVLLWTLKPSAGVCRIRSSQIRPPADWEHSVAIDIADAGGCSGPVRLALAPNGMGVAAWQHTVGGGSDTYAARYQ